MRTMIVLQTQKNPLSALEVFLFIQYLLIIHFTKNQPLNFYLENNSCGYVHKRIN